MNKPLHDFFTKDHERLDAILNEATANSEIVDETLYHQFRVGLLTHIKMEEKILFPAARRANNNEPIPMMAQLRLDHGALTALMTVPPTKDVIKVIRYILTIHDLKEEESGGMYDICERLTKGETDELLEVLAQTTEVPVHPPNPSDYVMGATKRALERAGYDFDEIAALKLSE